MKFQKRKPRRHLSNAERQERFAEAVFNYDILQRHNERASWRRQILEESDDKIDASVLLALLEKYTIDGVFDSDSAARELIILQKCVKKEDDLTSDIFASFVRGRVNIAPLLVNHLDLLYWARDFMPIFYAVELNALRNIPPCNVLDLADSWLVLRFAGLSKNSEAVEC